MPDRRFRLLPERISTSNVPLTSCSTPFANYWKFTFLPPLRQPPRSARHRSYAQLDTKRLFQHQASCPRLVSSQALSMDIFLYRPSLSFIYSRPTRISPRKQTFLFSNPMNLCLTPVRLPVYCRLTVCRNGAREWSYIATSLRQHAPFSLQSGCVIRLRIPLVSEKNPLKPVSPP